MFGLRPALSVRRWRLAVSRLCGQGHQCLAVPSSYPGIPNSCRQKCARVSRDANGCGGAAPYRERTIDQQEQRSEGPGGKSRGSVAPRTSRAWYRAQGPRGARGHQSLALVSTACGRDPAAISRAPGWMEGIERGGAPRDCDGLYQGDRLHRWLCGPGRTRSSVQGLAGNDAHTVSSRTLSRSGGSPVAVDRVQPAAVSAPPTNGPAFRALTFNLRRWSNGEGPEANSGMSWICASIAA